MTAKKDVTPLIEQDAAALTARIYALEEELAAAKEEINRLMAQAPKSGRSGWLIQTPHAGYNGTTAGVVFRSGAALLPDTEQGRASAQYIAAEFGYSVRFVEDWQDLPAAETLGRSLIDALMIPERR